MCFYLCDRYLLMINLYSQRPSVLVRLWSSGCINKGVNTSRPNKGSVVVVVGGESRWDGGKQMHFISPQCLFHLYVCWYHSSKCEGSCGCEGSRVWMTRRCCFGHSSVTHKMQTQPPVWSTFVLSSPSKPGWGGREEVWWASGLISAARLQSALRRQAALCIGGWREACIVMEAFAYLCDTKDVDLWHVWKLVDNRNHFSGERR